MKVSRIIALGLLIPLCGTAVVAVYLNAQDDTVPMRPKRAIATPDVEGEQPASPNSFVPRGIGSDPLSDLRPPQLPPANRRQFYFNVSDPKTLQLVNAEQTADQEARTLAAQYAQAATDEQRAEAKKKLREKLAAIFEMQQTRRTAEIAGIEERLAKLKDVSKKRETNKDPIVDRRLEQMTGGVDELGWEESNRGAIRFSVPALGPDYIEPNANSLNEQPLYGNPVLVPRSDNNVPATDPGTLPPVPELPRPAR